MTTTYFVVPRAGYFGLQDTVVSSHHSLKAAQKAARSHEGYEVREGNLVKGDLWFASDSHSNIYPAVS